MNNRKVYDYITKVAIFSALSFILYMFPKFPLPIFPSFLEIQFSNLPAILGGFVLGPVGGTIIVLARFIIKLPFSSTMYVGEVADLLLGLAVVLPSSIIYKYNRNKKGGIIALIIAVESWVISSIFINQYINIPFYAKMFGGMESVINACSVVIKGINADNFMKYYLLYACIPFNLLLSTIVAAVTFLVYKRISIIFKNDFIKNNKIKTLVICDSFKGTLSSKEISYIFKFTLNRNKYDVDSIIISDGGEGFLDAIENLSDEEKVVESFDAFRRSKEASYLVNTKTKTLFFELAEVVGIKDLEPDELNVYQASTYGLGHLIKSAVLEYPEVEEVIIGIGGSASNDGASGMLEAMGVKFFDSNNNLITNLCNEKLSKIESIDVKELKETFGHIKFTILTDVSNPLLGENGATYVYSPQKGAKDIDLPILENNLKHFSNVCTNAFQKDDTQIPGTGAAGGVGYGMVVFLDATLKSGIDTLLEINDFDNIVHNYDLIISGEGCIDEQSFQGKVLSGIIKHNPKRLELVVGFSKLKESEYVVHSVVGEVATMEESLSHPAGCLRKLIKKKFK